MSFETGEPLVFGARAEWSRWLRNNHARSKGVWLAIAKKHADGLHYEAAVEEAIRYGWIDSNVRRLDDDRYRQWYSPRKPGSAWSKSNKRRVERLLGQGRMTAAGVAAVEQAKRNGSWEHLDAVEELRVPPDLEKALHAHRRAAENFEKLAPSHRKQYLFWISEAKRDETRARRIRETVRRLAGGRNSRAE